MTTYNYTKTPVALDRLIQEIDESSITIALDSSGTYTYGSSLYVAFKTDISNDEKTILDGIVTNHTGELLIVPEEVEIAGVYLDNCAEKALKVTIGKSEESSTILVSPNFCDRTTWYGESERVTQETLETSDYLTYTADHGYWIDLTHGKIPYEERVTSSYDVKIYIDDVLTTTGFTIDYEDGSVTFQSSQEGKTIKATYSYENGSEWIIEPSSGKILKALGTRVRFSKDCQFDNLSQAIVFQVYVGGQAYGSPTVYNNITNFLTCCDRMEYTSSFSDLTQDIITFQFPYLTAKILKYSQSTSIGIKISNDTPLSGTFAYMIADLISIDE